MESKKCYVCDRLAARECQACHRLVCVEHSVLDIDSPTPLSCVECADIADWHKLSNKSFKEYIEEGYLELPPSGEFDAR